MPVFSCNRGFLDRPGRVVSAKIPNDVLAQCVGAGVEISSKTIAVVALRQDCVGWDVGSSEPGLLRTRPRRKDVAELGICGVAAAVANAIYNATGVRVRDYPITIDKLRSVCRT
jgi:hypothetical protein